MHHCTLLFAYDVENVDIDCKHEEKGRQGDPKKDEINHEALVDDLGERAILEALCAQIPAHGGHQADEDGHNPGHNHHGHGASHRHQALIAEGVADGQETFEGHGQQVEDGDVGDKHHHRVEQHAAVEIAGQTAVGQDGSRRHQEAHQNISCRQTADKAVGDRLKRAGLANGQQYEDVAQHGQYARQALCCHVYVVLGGPVEGAHCARCS